MEVFSHHCGFVYFVILALLIDLSTVAWKKQDPLAFYSAFSWREMGMGGATVFLYDVCPLFSGCYPTVL